MYHLATLVLSLGLIGIGFWRRRRNGLPVTQVFVTKLIAISFSIGTAIVGGAFPILYLLVMNAMRGGRVEDNMPTGLTPDSFLGLLMMPIVLSLGYAIHSYVDNLKSE